MRPLQLRSDPAAARDSNRAIASLSWLTSFLSERLVNSRVWAFTTGSVELVESVFQNLELPSRVLDLTSALGTHRVTSTIPLGV